MIKPVKSSSVAPQAGAGSSPRAKAPAKPAPVDNTLEFDFGGGSSSSTLPSSTPAMSTPAVPTEKTVELKKAEPVILTESKPRIHHTATPSPLSGGAKPAFASTNAVQIKNKFSVDSIKITDLTGELNQGSKNQEAIPMPEPEPTTPAAVTTPVTVKIETKAEPKIESKPEPKAAVTPNTPVAPAHKPAAVAPPTDPIKPASATPAPAKSVTTPSATSTRPSPSTPTQHVTSTHAGTTSLKETTTPTRNSTMALNQPSVSDFRKNAERQAKEQHAVGNVLTWVGYAALGAVLLFVALAGFGGYTLKKMIDSQSVSIKQLDERYSDQLAKQQADLAQLRADTDRLSDQLAATANLMAKQQEQLKRTAASADDSSAVLKARTRELNELRDRVRRLEGGRLSR